MARFPGLENGAADWPGRERRSAGGGTGGPAPRHRRLETPRRRFVSRPDQGGGWLDSLGLAPGIVDHVCQIVANISFKGAAVEQQPLSLEGQVVQDANHLDAMGAIGTARAFGYGGAKGRAIYDPAVQPTEHRTAESYLKGGTTINHFYEKLLLLKDRMNTATGRVMAEKRHRFMEDYLRQFFEEWAEDNEAPHRIAEDHRLGHRRRHRLRQLFHSYRRLPSRLIWPAPLTTISSIAPMIDRFMTR